MAWSWHIFFTYLLDPTFARAALVTLAIAAVAQAIGVAIGLVLALFSLSHLAVLRWLAAAYIWLWRGTPPLIQLVLLYFGLPQLGIRLGVLEAGLIGLGCYSASYIAEIIRAGVQSIDAGQTAAARSIGFSRLGTLRWIILPQAVRVILPPFGNEFASMMRSTSLLSVISFEELLRVTTLAINDTFRPIELYSVAACYYLLLYTSWTLIQQRLEGAAAFGAVRRPQSLSIIPDPA
ncbi:amino acid ABC transporter permease [Labrys monachus]|uniref:Polar amino acid transport system permease protein n=1 Tax=Labrys monachus TaxID=217067 RepID=A0ABU0FEV8_9HYPH|nr:amino acid ABC transporter permease [Labrys monachus]MDQ0393146.1 polar amino acid transport system permease protein [Labrys monachus]